MLHQTVARKSDGGIGCIYTVVVVVAGPPQCKYVRSYAYAHMTSHQQNMRYSTSAPFIPSVLPSVALALNSLVSADGVSPDIRRTHGVFEQHLGEQDGGSVRVY